MQTEVVIVGAGIWGLSTAYHLAKFGQKDVYVLERNEEIAVETTSQAAGLVGQIRSNNTMFQAIRYALELFSQFKEETGHDTSLRQTGSLMVALTPERMDAYARQIEMARINNIEADFVTHTEITHLVPELDLNKIEGGYLVPNDGYVNPKQCANAYAAAAKDLGVKFLLNTSVTGFRLHNGEIYAVETDKGLVTTNHLIVTAGPWGAALAEKVSANIPVLPIRHQRACTVSTTGIPKHHPVVRVPDVSCYLRPEKGGYLYGFFEPNPVNIDLDAMPDDFSTTDIAPPIEVIEEAKRRLTPIFPILRDLEISEYNQGMTTFAPDGAYMIGPVPDIGRLYLATGCAALGIAGSAAVGRWLANWVIDGEPGEDLSGFSHQRFSTQLDNQEWLRAESENFYANYYSIRTK